MSQNSRRLAPIARFPSVDPGVQPRAARPHGLTTHSVMVLALLVLVVAVDQAVKWWAWRHVSWTKINSGGDVIAGRTVGAWYADPVIGALLDLLDVGLLSTALLALARWRVPATVGVSGALMTGGWCSNLSDRLGIHYWTAPGSVRGVVDFIHIGGHYYNVADFFIISCTPVFVLAAGYHGVRAARRPAAAGSVTPPARSRARSRIWARARIPALAGAGLILVVALGAANYGGVNAAPPRPPTRKTTDIHVRAWYRSQPGHWHPGLHDTRTAQWTLPEAGLENVLAEAVNGSKLTEASRKDVDRGAARTRRPASTVVAVLGVHVLQRR